jgi:uncharacterized protein (TIGR02598 family)
VTPHRAAFTIIECVLALGIASSVLLGTIALLPAGMDALRDASQRSVEATIVAWIRQQSVGTNLLPPADLYFDKDGLASPSGSTESVYAVHVEQVEDASLPGDAEPSIRRIHITISDRAQYAPFADANRLRSYHLLFAPLPPG